MELEQSLLCLDSIEYSHQGKDTLYIFCLWSVNSRLHSNVNFPTCSLMKLIQYFRLKTLVSGLSKKVGLSDHFKLTCWCKTFAKLVPSSLEMLLTQTWGYEVSMSQICSVVITINTLS